MKRLGANVLLNCCLIVAARYSCGVCFAQESKPQTNPSSSLGVSTDASSRTVLRAPNTDAPGADDNSIGVPFLKHLVSDQEDIWTSPVHLRWADGSWLFPLAAVTAGFFATDRAVPPALSSDPTKLNRYVSISNYGLYSMIGAGGGLYVLSKVSHDDHQRETGVLAAEAAINSLAVDTALKYTFQRERPYQGQGQGNFYAHGDSFPSDHSILAWSIASVIAHEYPGTFTKVLVYGLATAVSATRVAGKQHFPSDVVVGGSLGWLIGRQVFRAHHDPELGGAGWDKLSGDDEREENRDRQHMGSPSVPLDSWVYPAFERLAALRAINTQIMGQKPWTRMECARLAEETSENLQQGQVQNAEEVARLQTQLAQEFGYEISLLSGGHNLTANLESVYTRAVSISGPALTDGYHFGQTIADDFGRPFERGTNGQAGGSFSASAGPLTLYVRAEYQHTPGAPSLSSNAISAISNADAVAPSEVLSGPFAPVNRIQLLDAYAGVNLGNWQLTLGTQSLSWTSAPNESMIWSDNIAPVPMVRLVNPEPIHLPSFLRFFGEVRIDQFVGRLQERYVPRPLIYGQKINMKPFPFLELGFARTSELGGEGSHNPITSRLLFQNFFGLHNNQLNSVPGKTSTAMDWTFYVPWVHNYIVLYGDAYAVDDVLPIKNPPKNPWRPGIYITRFPGLPKLDLHVEGVSTEQPGLSFDNAYTGGPANIGQFNYWNFNYRDGYTNAGNLIGNTVGRDGTAIQGWLTYWLSPRNSVQLLYRSSTVAGDFIPGGGAWQDYSVRNEMHLRSGFYVKTEFQYEHISRYPLLFKGSQNNFTAVSEIGFSLGERRLK